MLTCPYHTWGVWGFGVWGFGVLGLRVYGLMVVTTAINMVSTVLESNDDSLKENWHYIIVLLYYCHNSIPLLLFIVNIIISIIITLR